MAYYLRRSVLTLIWLLVAMLLLTSLISYSANDPSWSHISSHSDEVSNLAGRGGAWLADILYTFLGAASWWLIIIACYEAWRVWCIKTQPVGALRTLGYIFLIVATAALTGLFSLSWLAQGIVGQVVGLGLSGLLSTVGAIAFLLVFVIITLAFTFNIQLLRLFGKQSAISSATSADEQNTSRDDIQDSDSNRLPEDIARVLPTTQQLVLPLDEATMNEAGPTTSRFEQFLDETGFSDAKEYEWMETDPNAANNPFKPISSAHLANKKLTKKLDNRLQHEVIRTPKNMADVNTSSVLGEHLVTGKVEQDQGIVVGASVDDAQDAGLIHSQNISVTDSFNDNEFVNEIVNETDADNLAESIVEEPTSSTSHKRETSYNPFGMNFASVKLHVKQPSMTLADSPSESTAQGTTTNEMTASQSLDAAQSVTSVEDNLLANAQPASFATKNPLDSDDSFFSLESEDEHLKDYSNVIDGEQNYAVDKDPQQDFSVAELLGMRTVSQTTQPVAPAQQDLSANNVTESYAPPSVTASERSVEIDELKPVTPINQPLDIHDDTLFAGKSRAMQTAAYRASLSPLPSMDLLDLPDPNRSPSYSRQELQQLSELLEIKLQEFNVKATVVNAQLGPVVTRFEVELAPGVKASKVTGIAKDLARSLSMASVRVVEVIPGKPYIGIEVPNPQRQMVRLIELLQTEAFQDPHGLISMAMGKDIAGRPVISDLAKAPHMLVAGTTGSGKSVLVNSLLLSMLLKYTPNQLRLILIDPKQLELANYNDIPHLLTPVVTDMTEAASALSWCVAEMERRYQLMSLFKVRKLDEFNKKVIASNEQGHPLLDPLWRVHDSVSQDKPPVLKPLPQIVIVADEFADMMMQVGKQAEELITRLAQKSRAAGIHLILATQRPSVDVITGLIKANIPVRAALRVNSKVDSRTILDAGGAEDMLGHGDMLFLAPGQNEPNRVHGAFISDTEVNRICDAWRERGAPDYIDNMFDNFALTSPSSGSETSGSGIATGDEDALYDEVVAFVLETRKVSASSIQRKFSIGYNRAARIVDAMEEAGLVSAMGKSGKRELLV